MEGGVHEVGGRYGEFQGFSGTKMMVTRYFLGPVESSETISG